MNKLKLTILLGLFLGICTLSYAQKIKYSLGESSDSLIQYGIKEYYSLLPHLNKNKTFIRMNYDIKEIELVISAYQNYPKAFIKLIKKSNRFFKIEGKKIPIIFFEDDFSEYLNNKKNSLSIVIVRGYLLVIDREGKLISKGLLH